MKSNTTKKASIKRSGGIQNEYYEEQETVRLYHYCRLRSPSFGGLTVEGDGTDLDVLKKADISRANAVIAVTNNDNTNILIAQLAKEFYCVGRVISRLYDPERECVYRELGIDTICPAVLSANEIDKLLEKPAPTKEAV